MLQLRDHRKATLFYYIFYCVTLTYAKPANSPESAVPIPSPSPSTSEVVSVALPGTFTGARRIVHSRTDDGMWQASARLPSSSQTGGNDHSRYKIRRDGSLSLTLQGSQPHNYDHQAHTPTSSNNNYHTNYYNERVALKKIPDSHNTAFQDNDVHRENRRGRDKPIELRSFSVVLSDVDVTGRYGEENAHEDSYSEAGVSGYHLHSNSIHRMNASWKLNSRNSSPTSEDLLQFLSLFSNDKAEEPSHNDNNKLNGYGHYNNPYNNPNQKLMGMSTPTMQEKEADVEILIPQPYGGDKIGDKDEKDVEEQIEEKLNHHLKHHLQVQMQDPTDEDDNLPPFSTWSESSRNLFDLANNNSNVNSTQSPPDKKMARSRNDGKFENSYNGTSTSSDATSKVLLHDLLIALDKFSQKSESEESDESSLEGINYKKENSTHDFQANSGNDTEKVMTKQTNARMKISDPQQTASDLKKLMSLLLSSNGGAMKDPRSGAEVVNIVITPNTNPKTNGNGGGDDDRQKILFLKSPQVKQLLDAALSDPAVSSAAQKIAAALHVPQYDDHYSGSSNSDANPLHLLNPSAYNSYNKYNGTQHISSSDSDISEQTPDGFPLTGAGFLNLHHPNLQFHQALHHLVANGSAPTSINATTKTNVINIFVLNFNGNNNNNNNKNQHQQGKLKIPVPFAMKPLLLENVNADVISHDDSSVNNHQPPSSLITNKIGLAATESSIPKWPFQSVVNHDHQESLYDILKPTTTTTTLAPLPPHLLAATAATNTNHNSNANKVNILDLLPGDISAYTPVEYDKGVTDKPQSQLDFSSSFISDPSRGATTKRPISSTPSALFHHVSNPNIKDREDILAYLASVNKKYTSTTTTTTENPLPPELAQLGWIFKNQPPPKPIIPYKPKNKMPSNNPNSQKNNAEITSILNYDETDFPDGEPFPDSDPDSMMETDETSNHHLALQNNISPDSIKFDRILFVNDDNGNNTNHSEVSNSTQQHSTESQMQIAITTLLNGEINNTESGGSNETNLMTSTSPSVVTITKKPPAFSKFGIKIPPGGFPDDGTDLNTRVRKLLTALGFSAIPTLAAGAAATWPYWVPLVATGRRRRKRDLHEKNKSNEHLPTEELLVEFSKKANKELKVNTVSGRMAKMETSTYTNESSSSMSTTPVSRLATTVSNSSATKGKEEGQEAKWIKVEVITQSSPTFASVNNTSSSNSSVDASNSNGNSSSSDNNRQFENGEPQDVPLLKNFLKNVLSNEWSISTTTPSSSHTLFPMRQQQQPTPTAPLPPPHSFPFRPMHYSSNSFPSSAATANNEKFQLQQIHQQNYMNNDNEPVDNNRKNYYNYNHDHHSTSSLHPNKFEIFKPTGQDANLIVGVKKIKRPTNSIIEQMSKKKLAAAIQAAEESYSSAALFPIWFPILLGHTRVPVARKSVLTVHSTKTDLTFGRTIDSSPLDKQRNHRRLTKWDKDGPIQMSDEGDIDNNDNEDEGHLFQSLTSISSHLLDKNDDSLENSSEKDVYLHEDQKDSDLNNKNKQRPGNNEKIKNNAQEQEEEETSEADTEELVSEEDGDKQSSVTTSPKRITPAMSLDLSSPSAWPGDDSDNENNDTEDNTNLHKLKSDAHSTSTPKGLTTWSAVNGGISTSSSSYFKGSAQKLPSDHTVSGMLSFSTDRSMTTSDMLMNRDYSTSVSPPRTTKAKPQSEKPKRKRPYTHVKKVLPNKFVKPNLQELQAEPISSDDKYNTYQLVPVEAENKAVPVSSNKYNGVYNTKRPLWPGQVQTPTTRRPVNVRQPFQKITSRPKNPYVKQQTGQPILTLTTPTTTTPPTTTVYYRNPTSSLISPFPMVSLTNMPFMDFLRSQIIPRIGLSLLSFMTTTPLLLSLLGAAAGAGRRKRDVSQSDLQLTDQFQQKMIPVENLDTLHSKWEQIDKAEQRKDNIIVKRPNPNTKKVSYDRSDNQKEYSLFTQLLHKLFRSSEMKQEKNSRKES